MIKTKLFKAVDHLAVRIREELSAAGLHEVVSPPFGGISVLSNFHSYHIDFAILAAPNLHLRFRTEVEKELDGGALTDAAARTARTVARARDSRDAVLRMLETATRDARLAFERSKIEDVARLIGVRLAPMRVDAVDLTFKLEIGYEGLDHRLRTTLRTIEVQNSSTLDTELANQELRAANRRLARNVGGVGLVDGVTLAAITALAEDPKAFLGGMARNHLILLDVPYGRGSQQGVEWSNGVVGMQLWIDDKLRFGRGSVTLRWPDRDLDLPSLTGTRLSDLIEHPLLPAGLVVEDASWDDTWPQLRSGRDDHDLRITFVDRLHAFNADGVVLS